MYEQYGMGQYPFPWGGVTPPPNWQPQTPPMQQSQQGIQGVRFVSGIEEAKNCTIPLGSKALLMDKEKDRFYLKETDITGVSTVSEFEFKKVEAEAPEVALGQANLQMQASNNAAAISQQLATCCCETQRAIDGVNYNAARNTASINANTTAAVQKVLDAIQQDKIEALQGQVNQLQLQSALCGVVRYPNSTTFTAGYNPYFNANACGCGTTF